LSGNAIRWNEKSEIPHICIIRCEEDKNMGRDAGDNQHPRSQILQPRIKRDG
jgi:hypothetical protein